MDDPVQSNTKPSEADKPRTPRACDLCRRRKVKCRWAAHDDATCVSCSSMGARCTWDIKPRKRGRPNRHAPASPVTTGRDANSLPQSPHGTIVEKVPRDQGPSPEGSQGVETQSESLLSLLGTASSIQKALDDWFEFFYPIQPLLHRRYFISRFQGREMHTNSEFLALVISMCAATVATLPRKAATEYNEITVSNSLHLIRHYNLLQSTMGCSVDWCVAYYLLSWAQMGEHGFTGFDVFNNLKSAMSGVQWLLSFQPRQKSVHDEEILKRLYWQLTILDIGLDTKGWPGCSFYPLSGDQSRLRPRCLSDEDLYTAEGLMTGICASHDDTVDYVTGFNAHADIILTWWHAKADSEHRSPREIIDRGLERLQSILDSLPPELRWRGGLSRDPRATRGNEMQMLNIMISFLYIKSNLLEIYGPVAEPPFTHCTIISDVLEILHHVPRTILESVGFSVVKRIRDMGAPYLEELKLMSNADALASEPIRQRLWQLLSELELLDYQGRPGISTHF
ncbi:unnamed protein product [Clonostachys rhizophaga]|uniref:Zn(2)-C6 fungal-type domain-containing protein n=1 Tax=Clonostachys rhizophaga TaxID=160324 RepID=A0A9N9YK69_9HYPO|nr:unnamed protein product [Clonostachys rhizophaga]